MDIEIINAIAKLWPLALVVFLALFVILFRAPLKSQLERLSKFQFKRGQTEVMLSHEAEEAEIKSKPPSEEEVALQEKPATEVRDKFPRAELATPDEWARKMIFAFLISRDIKEGDEAFDMMQEAEINAVKKLKNEALYLWLRYECGDTSALRKLQDLANRERVPADVSHDAQRFIGHCYQKAGDFEKAVVAYEAAVQGSQTENERANDIVEIAACLFKAAKQQNALTRLMHEIGRVTDSDALSAMYRGLASLYELAKDSELRALALEKALEINPNDTELHFGAAYSYGKQGLSALALLHYETLLKFKPDEPMALNNIGVQYNALQMPMRAAKSYKKAVELNETLAAANLAYQFLNAGFEEEASQILDKAKQQANLHPNVGKAISAISDRSAAESQTEESSLNAAREQQRFILAFAEAYFTEKPDCPQFSGLWQSSDGSEVEMTQTKAAIEANWGSDNKRHKFTGTISNRGAKITIFKEQYVWWPKTKLEFVKESAGYAYLTPDGQQLLIMTLKEHEHSFMKLIRK